MILATVGTLPFDRLVCAVDELAMLLQEPVIIQRALGSYIPRHAQHAEYVDHEQMQAWISKARVVIAHAGAGTILDILTTHKPLVLVPRKASLGEHYDDHQFELAGALAEQGWAITVTDLSAETLSEALEQATALGRMTVGEIGLHAALRDWLDQQATRPPSRRLRLIRWLAGDR